ncbi:MAG: EpsG family protein [bacterium]
MSPYLLAFIVPIALSPIRKRSTTAYVFLVAGIWAVFAGLRGEIGGTDYYAYKGLYLNSEEFISRLYTYERLFTALVRLCQALGFSYNGFLLVVAILGILPSVYVIDKRSGLAELALFVYGIEFMLPYSFIFLRQGVALGLAFLALDTLMDDRKIGALLFTVIAANFHYSALILIPFIIVNREVKPGVRSGIYWMVAFSGISIIVLSFSEFGKYFAKGFFEKLLRYLIGGGMTINPLNFLEIYLIFVVLNRKRNKNSHPALWNSFDLVLLFFIFGTIEAIFIRFAVYFKAGVLILLSRAVDKKRGIPGESDDGRDPVPLLGRLGSMSVRGKTAGEITNALFDARVLQIGVFCYYLAKIVRWLLLNVNDVAVFLPYRTIL